MSASTWQGWYSLVRPLITGTRELAAKRDSISCWKVRIITRSHIREITCPASSTGSPPKLRVPRIQIDRRAAELVHTRLERQARARRGLLEDHGEGAVFERPVALVALELVLDPARAREQMLVLLAREVLELQVVPQQGLRLFHARAGTAAAGCSRNERTRGTRMERIWRASLSFMMSGGSSRITLSMVTLMSRPASRACPTRLPQGRSSSTPIIRP